MHFSAVSLSSGCASVLHIGQLLRSIEGVFWPISRLSLENISVLWRKSVYQTLSSCREEQKSLRDNVSKHLFMFFITAHGLWVFFFFCTGCHLWAYSLFFVLLFNRHIYYNYETRRLGIEETQKTVISPVVRSQSQFCYVKFCVYALSGGGDILILTKRSLSDIFSDNCI